MQRMKPSWWILAAAVAAAPPAIAQTRIVALTNADEAAYREAFRIAETGDPSAARARLAGVEDNVLTESTLGVALTRSAASDYPQFADWLARNSDLPITRAVFERALTFRPFGAPRLPEPTPPSVRAPPGAAPPPPDSDAARNQIAAVQENMSNGALEVARSLAAPARSGPLAGEAERLLGLIAFRMRDYSAAARHFEASARWPHHDRDARAGAHFWAARALSSAGRNSEAERRLESAAQAPQTFYGQLALAKLGRTTSLRFEPPPLEPETLRAFLDRRPAARRAAAFAQLGRLSDVEAELLRLHGALSPEEDAIFLALAQALAAPTAQLRAAEYGGADLAAGFCPVTTFEPQGGFALDRALVYAIVRQESAFNPLAVSVSDARGLMQLLPSTAADLDRSRDYRNNPNPLFEPGENMRLGQAYVLWLMQRFHSDGDLARIFAAYNGGPGWLRRWLADAGDVDDALLLLEMIPRPDTRAYVKAVLSHMALCRRRFGQPTPEMDALAAGRPALYRGLDAPGDP